MDDAIRSYLMGIATTLEDVISNHGLSINYAKICYCAMRMIREKCDVSEWPFAMENIYDKLGITVKKQNLNDFMEAGDKKKINQIIGKISIRPDYSSPQVRKTTVYAEETASLPLVNYALAHELCHLILYHSEKKGQDKTFFYTDDYCIMPMLPKDEEEMIADAFAVFLLIPFDKFLETFKKYIEYAKTEGNVPITTEEWLSYLSAVSAVPYYYVACGYQQIRQLAYLIYHVHKGNEEQRKEYANVYGEEVLMLYDLVKETIDDELIEILYQ